MEPFLINMKKLKSVSRILIAASAVLMVVSYFVPLWQILMWAPQYPEGLEMKIWLNNITGDYKIISGLNHYIGMKHIEVSMFPEFGYMVYIVGGIIAFGLVTAIANRRAILISYIAVIVLAAIAGMVDFYMWGYDYGHNLDPNAPIIVPGMAYQPPLIGTKQLLKFTAYSAPDAGGYVFLAAGLLAISALVLEIRTQRSISVAAPLSSALIIFLLCSCSTSPEPLQFGKDGCHACKMTLMDNRFGGEVVTRKGKVYKFDDLNCMAGFLKSGEVSESDAKHILVVDFANPASLIDATHAVLVSSPEIKSPMAGNTAAFSDKSAAERLNAEWQGTFINWSQVQSH
jgi:copper chaperone NosL